MTSRKIILAVAASFAFATLATAADPTYPPYPDVWGRELPVAERKFASIEIYTDPDRRVVVNYYEGEKDMAMDFFTGQVRELKVDETNSWIHLRRENPAEYRRSLTKIDIGPNDRVACLQRHILGNRGVCWHNFNSSLWRGADFLRPRISKMLFSILDKPFVEEQDSDCGFFHKPIPVTYQVESYFLCSIYLLDDGTFLAASHNLETVIRFRPDLTSPYIRNRKLFLVDTSTIDKIEETENYNLHTTNQMVFDLLTKLRKESSK